MTGGRDGDWPGGREGGRGGDGGGGMPGGEGGFVLSSLRLRGGGCALSGAGAGWERGSWV